MAEWLGSWGVLTRLTDYALGFDRYRDLLLEWLGEHPSLDLSFIERRKDIHTLKSLTIPLANGDKYLLCIGYAQPSMAPPRAELLVGVEFDIKTFLRQATSFAVPALILLSP